MMTLPTATYRLQLNRDFNFERAAAVVPYLAELGISHCYVSPIMKARAGSMHGYDIVDHNALNPELGDAASFERFVAQLQNYGMGLIVDFVPNHMGVGGDDNAWWLDVLEHGPASPYADYFDIDWQPLKPELHGKVLLPLLGDHYGSVLERGELRLTFDAAGGVFSFRYFRHRFPLDPASYRELLLPLLQRPAPAPLAEPLQRLLRDCEALPGRSATAAHRCAAALGIKQALAALCAAHPALPAAVEQCLAEINGRPGVAASFDRLDRLLERQAYRLAYWRVAADEINYRRFVDINELAGLSMERPEVFDATHRLILQLAAEGKVQGLRIDHPDGLADPAGYYRRLRSALAARGVDTERFYLVIEKVLLGEEQLPSQWAVHGTTGYDFCNQVSQLLLYGPSARALERTYHRVLGAKEGFDELLYRAGTKIINDRLSSELTVLANMLDALAQGDRHTRDFTHNGLRRMLVELAASFPVYRTYVGAGGSSARDRHYLAEAVARAKARRRLDDDGIYEFVHRLLNLDTPAPALAPLLMRFVQRFQQYTPPVVAKTLEDTVGYRYYRLSSLNEIGGELRQFGLSRHAFHEANRQRLLQWPYAMLTTSTHDSKRSEDVRMRIHVIAEMPELWQRWLVKWRRANRANRSAEAGTEAPARNDEYLFYQTLLGTWPLLPPDEATMENYRGRMVDYLRKAAREAKEVTSWFTPNAVYEAALERFVRRALRSSRRNSFTASIDAVAQRLAPYGLYASLSQLLLKLTVPGVPDLFQGSEAWCLQLVDPDNRRPVDFVALQAMLERLQHEAASPDLLRRLTAAILDGRAKLYLTWRLLSLRRAHPALFQAGDYLPLWAQGAGEAHVVAFARVHAAQAIIVVAPRWFGRLPAAGAAPPLGREVWGDTQLLLPGALAARPWRNLLSDSPVHAEGGVPGFAVGELLADFPVAVLVALDETE